MKGMLGHDLLLAATFAEMWVDGQIANQLNWIKAGAHKTHLVKWSHPTPPVSIKRNTPEVPEMLRMQASIFGLVI